MTAKQWQFLFVQSLTFGRMPLIMIFFVITILTDTSQSLLWFWLAYIPMVASTLTDIFDGYYARKFGVTSQLGAYADPLTDKIFYLTTFPALIYVAAMQGNWLHTKILVVMTVLFLLRDQWISFLRSIGALYQMDAKANWSGKWRTIVSFTMICVVYWQIQAPDAIWLQLPDWVSYLFEAASLFINFVSIHVYTKYYWPCLKKEMAQATAGKVE